MSNLTHHPHDLPERKPRLRFRLLRWLAARLPRRPIDADGQLYLERYYLAGPINDATASLWPEQDRPKPRLTWLPRTWYLHRFYTPDPDPCCHNHPWEAYGRVLAGAYVEARLEVAPVAGALIPFPKEDRVIWEGQPTHVSPSQYHRIKRLIPSIGDPREVWTLLRCGPVQSGWGFLVGTAHVNHADYHARPVYRKHEKRGRLT